jgi:signal transduction histidine kinase
MSVGRDVPFPGAFVQHEEDSRLGYRMRLTVLATLHVILAIPSIALLALAIASVPLALVGLGIFTAEAAALALPGIVRWELAIASPLIDAPTPASRVRGWARLRTALVDNYFWRSWCLLLFIATLGLIISSAVLGLLVSPIAYLVLLIIEPSTLWLALLIGSILLWMIWWTATPMLMRWRAEIAATIMGSSRTRRLAERIRHVERSRSDALDRVGNEVRRIERDLHDGAQARLAAVGMSVGLAENLLRSDPDTAAALLRDAREMTMAALEDIRAVVRGIHPPVLADRGLAEAVRALSLGVPISVTVDIGLPSRPKPALESALYFAIAECLANATKHSRADRIWVTGGVRDARARFVVGDDGRGGADPAGHGILGLTDRLGAFDGEVFLDSPRGGPTLIMLEVPWD